jgi:uncharacterized Zn-binding protein involved in type VI secretion
MAIIGFVVLGDKTSHGGEVVSCTSNRTVNGKEVARLNDLVSCPRCNRTAKIISSRFPAITSNGVPLAFDRDMTDCGAEVYSSVNGFAGHNDGSSGEP